MTLAHEPPFDRRALRWFRRRLADTLTGATDAPVTRFGLTGSEPYFPHVLDWYCARATEYVYWTASAEFHGRGFSAGAWRLYYGDISKDFLQALATATRTHAARALGTIDSLEEWLAADLAGTLPAAPLGGSYELPKESRERLALYAQIRRNTVRMPKSCPSCGAEWTVRSGESFPHDLRAKRCPSCRESSSRKRTPAQGAK